MVFKVGQVDEKIINVVSTSFLLFFVLLVVGGSLSSKTVWFL